MIYSYEQSPSVASSQGLKEREAAETAPEAGENARGRAPSAQPSSSPSAPSGTSPCTSDTPFITGKRGKSTL